MQDTNIQYPGHYYDLDNFEEGVQEQRFIHKEPDIDSKVEGALKTVSDGTTNEEVLACLIHRLNYLQNKFPCRENAIAITHIETALLWLNHRTANRKARGVEGKQIK